MPFFDWSAPWDQVVIEHRLWVYFAVNVPLTIIILVVVSCWVSRQRAYRRKIQTGLNLRPSRSSPTLKKVEFGLIPWFKEDILNNRTQQV
jgi:hypothetical protein